MAFKITNENINLFLKQLNFKTSETFIFILLANLYKLQKIPTNL